MISLPDGSSADKEAAFQVLNSLTYGHQPLNVIFYIFIFPVNIRSHRLETRWNGLSGLNCREGYCPDRYEIV